MHTYIFITAFIGDTYSLQYKTDTTVSVCTYIPLMNVVKYQ